MRNVATHSRAFRELGFTDYEARVYVALLQCAPATAYEVSKLAELPRANVYSALLSLEKKMAVQPISEGPLKYMPVDPKELLDRIARDTAARCDSLKEKLGALKLADNTQYVWIVSGGDNASAKIDETIAGAKRHVWIKAHQTVLGAHFDALKAAAGRGVKVLLIVFGEPKDAERFRVSKNITVYLHESNGWVVGLARYLVTITTDFEQALVVNTKPDEGYAAFTQSRPIVNLADSLIRHEIYLAEIFDALGPQLESRFGRALLSLRQQYLPSEQVRALEKSLRRSS